MSDKKLFEAFTPVNKEQWIQQVVKDLKGKSYEETLTYTTADGILVSPFYTKEDFTADMEFKPLFNHTDWDICAEVDGTNEEVGNRQILYALTTGATSLICNVHAQVNLGVLCKQVQLQHISTLFVLKGDVGVFTTNLAAYLKQQGLTTDEVPVIIAIDPIAHLLRTGNWLNDEEHDFKELQQAVLWGGTLCVNGNLYQQAGAPPAYEVGCLLGHTNLLLQYLIQQQTPPKTVQLTIAVGGDYFFEIAKLRAIRKVFALLFKEYGIQTTLLLHAETSSLNMTRFDEYNNVLRATTAAMAAAVGGCNSIFVKPFDVLHHPGNQEAERLSRNIQLILKEESYLNQMADISAGAYYIEYLTEQIAQKSWANFAGLEKHGTYLENIQQAAIQQHIEAFFDQQQRAFNEGKIVLVGSNKFPNLKEEIATNAVVSNESKFNTAVIVRQLHAKRLSSDYEQQRISKQGVNS